MAEGVCVAVHDGADRNTRVTVRRIDGVDRRDGHAVRNIGHDPEDVNPVPLLQDVGESDRGRVVPPSGEVGVDDDARYVVTRSFKGLTTDGRG